MDSLRTEVGNGPSLSFGLLYSSANACEGQLRSPRVPGLCPREARQPGPRPLRMDTALEMGLLDGIDLPTVLERGADFGLRDPPRPFRAGFLFAEAEQEIAAAGPQDLRDAV